MLQKYIKTSKKEDSDAVRNVENQVQHCWRERASGKDNYRMCAFRGETQARRATENLTRESKKRSESKALEYITQKIILFIYI